MFYVINQYPGIYYAIFIFSSKCYMSDFYLSAGTVTYLVYLSDKYLAGLVQYPLLPCVCSMFVTGNLLITLLKLSIIVILQSSSCHHMDSVIYHVIYHYRERPWHLCVGPCIFFFMYLSEKHFYTFLYISFISWIYSLAL